VPGAVPAAVLWQCEVLHKRRCFRHWSGSTLLQVSPILPCHVCLAKAGLLCMTPRVGVSERLGRRLLLLFCTPAQAGCTIALWRCPCRVFVSNSEGALGTDSPHHGPPMGQQTHFDPTVMWASHAPLHGCLPNDPNSVLNLLPAGAPYCTILK
jgi:hypothetical protein